MGKPWTKERLASLTAHQLQNLYANARQSNDPQADDIIEMIFRHGLLDAIGGGMPRHSPVIQAIEAICRSRDGVDAAIAASKRGEAAMAGVDPILRQSIREYGYADTASWAGTFVADEMEASGLKRKGRKSLPSNCVAKTAAFFEMEPN